VRFWLTDAGRALREPVEAERRLLEERITESLTPAEREHLMRALAKICQSASDLLAADPAEPDDRPA
jgi:DNA-binding MarR family transcriptional regulator